MALGQREFHALSGQELEQIMLKDMQRTMEESGEFKQLYSYPVVSYRINIDVYAYDRDEQLIELDTTGTIRNQETGKKITLSFERPLITSPDALREEVGLPTIQTTQKNGVTFDEPTPITSHNKPRRRPPASVPNDLKALAQAVGTNEAPTAAAPETGSVDFERGINIKARKTG